MFAALADGLRVVGDEKACLSSAAQTMFWNALSTPVDGAVEGE